MTERTQPWEKAAEEFSDSVEERAWRYGTGEENTLCEKKHLFKGKQEKDMLLRILQCHS